MRFVVDQPVRASLGVVEAAFLDPSFYQALGTMDALAPPEIQERRADPADPDLVHLRIRYAFAGRLAPPARAVLDPAKLTWIDESTLDRRRHRVDFRMVPEHYVGRLACSGCYRFEEDPEEQGVTHQLMEGEVRVRYPMVGAVVERAIVMGLRQHLAEEAVVLERWAAERA